MSSSPVCLLRTSKRFPTRTWTLLTKAAHHQTQSSKALTSTYALVKRSRYAVEQAGSSSIALTITLLNQLTHSPSGKSSLISALIRTLDLNTGKILIDGIDITKQPRSHIRSSINTITQHPFFLPGTVRLNVNPEGNISDAAIIQALKTVTLWPHIESKGGLNAEMQEDLLSHGQQQLFCLARALCKESKIFVMDEATSR